MTGAYVPPIKIRRTDVLMFVSIYFIEVFMSRLELGYKCDHMDLHLNSVPNVRMTAEKQLICIQHRLKAGYNNNCRISCLYFQFIFCKPVIWEWRVRFYLNDTRKQYEDSYLCGIADLVLIFHPFLSKQIKTQIREHRLVGVTQSNSFATAIISVDCNGLIDLPIVNIRVHN